MSKTYILQKDLPDSKAGDEYMIGPHNCYYKNGDFDSSWWGAIQVENNPEWFKEKEEKEFTRQDMINFALFLDAKLDNDIKKYGYPKASMGAFLDFWERNTIR